jgi:PAS domain-containing protein
MYVTRITRRTRRSGGALDPVTLEALTQSAGLVRSPLGAVVFDTELQIVWVNQAAERLGNSLPAAAWPGRRLGEVLPHLDIGLIERSLRRVLATGEAVDGLEVSSHTDDPGGERLWSCVQFRVDGPDGRGAGVAHAMREVTEQARNQRRLALGDAATAPLGPPHRRGTAGGGHPAAGRRRRGRPARHRHRR